MGATVALLQPNGEIVKRVFTDHAGAFTADGLAPGFYSIKVTLSRFIPLLRDDVNVEAGARTFLSVSLQSLFAGLQLSYVGRGSIEDMTDDWKRVLRVSHSRRPALRISPNQDHRETERVLRKISGAFTETSAYAELSGGGGMTPTALANQTDLGTSFALATSLFGENNLTVSGNFGYAAASASPTTAFSTSYRRDMGFAQPEVTVTMRQLQTTAAADRAFLDPAASGDAAPALETLTFGYADRAQVGDNTHVEYGFLYESVNFVDRLNYISPFGKMVRTFGKDRSAEIRYASGAPRPDAAVQGRDGLRSQVRQLGMFPRVALRDGEATVQRTEHIELAYRERVGNGMIEAGVYQDTITDAALTAMVPDHMRAGGQVLPDLFSRSSTINGGRHFSRGYRVSYARKLADRLEAALGYGNTGVVTSDGRPLETADVSELRQGLGVQRAHMLTASISTELPGSETRLASSYQWLSRQGLIEADMYNDFAAASAAGWNIVIRQPLPLDAGLPGKMEVSADLRNLLKAGYQAVEAADGSTLYLMPAFRSYRGSLSFIF